MKAPEDIRVIDLAQAMAAPFCTMNLADMGGRFSSFLALPWGKSWASRRTLASPGDLPVLPTR
jgi:hypothetical protein